MKKLAKPLALWAVFFGVGLLVMFWDVLFFPKGQGKWYLDYLTEKRTHGTTLADLTEQKRAAQPAPWVLSAPKRDSSPVYVLRLDKRWHLSAVCAGEGAWIDTWGNAKQRGLLPCARCAGG